MREEGKVELEPTGKQEVSPTKVTNVVQSALLKPSACSQALKYFKFSSPTNRGAGTGLRDCTEGPAGQKYVYTVSIPDPTIALWFSPQHGRDRGISWE